MPELRAHPVHRYGSGYGDPVISSAFRLAVAQRGKATATRQWSTPFRWIWGVWHAHSAAVLFALALALRLTFVLAVDQKPYALDDQALYSAGAAQLVAGHGFSTVGGLPTAAEPPGFGFALAAVYQIFGFYRVGGEVLNAVLGALTVPLVYFIVLRTVGRRAARVAGLVMAVLPGQIYFCDALLSESLYTFILVSFFALAIRLPNRRRSYVVLGLVAGLGMLTRGEGFLLLAVTTSPAVGRDHRPRTLFAVWMVAERRPGAREPSQRRWCRSFRFDELGRQWSGHNPRAELVERSTPGCGSSLGFRTCAAFGARSSIRTTCASRQSTT